MRSAPPRAVRTNGTGRKFAFSCLAGHVQLPTRYREIYAYTLWPARRAEDTAQSRGRDALYLVPARERKREEGRKQEREGEKKESYRISSSLSLTSLYLHSSRVFVHRRLTLLEPNTLVL